VGTAVGGTVSTAVGGAVSGAVALLRALEVLVKVVREAGIPHLELSLGLETFRTVLCCIVLYCVSYSIV